MDTVNKISESFFLLKKRQLRTIPPAKARIPTIIEATILSPKKHLYGNPQRRLYNQQN